MFATNSKIIIVHGTNDCKSGTRSRICVVFVKLTKFRHLIILLGRTINVNVVAVTSHSIGNSEPSNTLQVTCPTQPAPPHIVQQPSYKKGSVTIAFEKPSNNVPYGEDIIFYR